MIIVDSIKSKIEYKKFLRNELSVHQERLSGLTPGTEEYDKTLASAIKIKKELYPEKNGWQKAMDVVKIAAPIGLGVYAYHKEEVENESKNGTTFSLASKLLR